MTATRRRPPTIVIDPRAVVVDRFNAKFVEAPSGCHIWVGAKNSGGYGVFVVDGRQVYAHRVAWTLTHGELSAALSVDHLCRVRRCVNAVHLDAVPYAVNTERQPRSAGKRTRCPQGHLYAGDNLYLFPDGRRACRACQRAAQARYVQRKAAMA